jgi:hypothetical protein
VQDFIADLQDRDVDGYGRSFFLVGAEVTEGTLMSRTEFETALNRFSELAEAPIRVVVVQPGDSPEYVFVPGNPSAEVERLLERLQITSSNIVATRPYKRLHLVRLEVLLPSLVQIAFGMN